MLDALRLSSWLVAIASVATWMCQTTSEAFSIPPSAMLSAQTTIARSRSGSQPPTCLFAMSEDEDDEDDDGWGTTTSSLETDRKFNELRSLQEQAAANKASQPLQSVSTTGSNDGAQPERDMFIPIMAVVSLAGLFGAYGYETLRLASRGELYLPFGNNQ